MFFTGALFLQRRERAEQDRTVATHQNGSPPTPRAAALTCWIRAISRSSLRKLDGQHAAPVGQRQVTGVGEIHPVRQRSCRPRPRSTRGQGHPVHDPAGVRGDADELGSGLAAHKVGMALPLYPSPAWRTLDWPTLGHRGAATHIIPGSQPPTVTRQLPLPAP